MIINYILRVFPGGQVDQGEDFISTLLREITEETGIDIQKDTNSNSGGFIYTNTEGQTYDVEITPITFYESVFPDYSKGFPSSHCLIVFYFVSIKTEKENINLNIQLNEVDAYAWIYSNTFRDILFNKLTCVVTGSVYSESDLIFKPMELSEMNFLNYDTGEFVPYGHRLAFKLQIEKNLNI
jgi:8-oxo-dGTP pyrophosphatase MutT (NUDIX family)